MYGKQSLINTAASFMNLYDISLKEFEIKAEEAKKLYWDACKYPRKKKKKIRKQAKADFELYTILSQPVF